MCKNSCGNDVGFKATIETDFCTVVYQDKDNLCQTADAAATALAQLMIAAGWCPENVIDAFYDYAVERMPNYAEENCECDVCQDLKQGNGNLRNGAFVGKDCPF